MKKTNKRITPDFVTELSMCEVFVFGSNLEGCHGGGAARIAYERFGAVWGQGVGPQGKSYAIPTMHGPISSIKPYVDDLLSMPSNTLITVSCSHELDVALQDLRIRR